ncbi:MAG: flippase [Vicingaceae bacterium]|nr:flippase [Vicingaceae bacterium]
MLQTKFQEIKQSAFFHDILHSFVSRGIYIGLGFLVTILITRNFTVEAYGEYSYLLSIALTCFQLTHLGFSSANTFYVVHNKRLLPFLTGNTAALTLVVGFVSLFVLLALNSFYFHRDVCLILATALIVPFQVMSLLNKGLLVGLKKVKVSNYYELISRVIYSLIIVGLVIYYQSILLLLVAYVLQMALLSITTFFSLKKHSLKNIKPSLKLFKTTSSYSIRIYITLFLSFLVLRIDVYFIEHILGDKPLGIYSLAATLASNLILIIQVVIPLLVPKLAGIKDSLEKIKKLKNIILYAFVLLLVINGVFVLFGEWVITFVFGAKYIDSVPVFKILLLATSILSLESILAQYYATIGKIKFLIYYWLIALCLNLTLNYLWIPEYGIEGASWASLISYSLMLVLLLVKIVREIYFIKARNENNV